MNPEIAEAREISAAEHAADCIEAWIWRHSEEKKPDTILAYDEARYVLSFRDLQLVLDDRLKLQRVVDAARDVLSDGLREDGIRPDTDAEEVSEWLTNGNRHSLAALCDALYKLDGGAS